MPSNPEIPSFKNPAPDGGKDKKEEKKGSGMPVLGDGPGKPPTLGGKGGMPALRVRGLSGGPKSLIERLKQFQKKDLIFIASGLGVLFMAPLAEHFLMSPTQDSALQPGFSSPGGLFNGEAGVHEPGTGGMSPGNLVGSNGDIITPLNVRDPSALIMAPGTGEVKTPPTASTVAPPSAPSKEDHGGWKDALSAAKSGAERGAEAAKATAFKAAGQLSSSLRGLAALSGGSYSGGPTFNLAAPNASNAPNHTGGGSNLSRVQAAPGYSGAYRGLDAGGGADAAKAAAEKAASMFNRPGSAINNLEQAAKETMPGGSSGNAKGGPNAGGENKNPGNNSGKDNKSLGENLAYLKAKMEMEKALDLKWSKKKWQEFEFPKMIYEDLTKSAIQNIVGNGIFLPFARQMMSMWAGLGSGGDIMCWMNDPVKDPSYQKYPAADQTYIYSIVHRGDQGYQVQMLPADGSSKLGQFTPAYAPYYHLCINSKGGGASENAPTSDPSTNLAQTVPGVGTAQQQASQLENFLKVNKCDTAAPSIDKWVCDLAKERLLPLYDQLGTVEKSAWDKSDSANAHLQNAWYEMQKSAQGMLDATTAMKTAGTEFGVEFGDVNKPADPNVLTQAKAAKEKLDQAAQEQDAQKAQELIAEAKALLGGKGQGGSPEGGQGASGARAAFEAGKEALHEAAQKREPINRAIQDAQQEINKAAGQVSAGAQQLNQAEKTVSGAESEAREHGGKGAGIVLGDPSSNQPGLLQPMKDEVAALRSLMVEFGGADLAKGADPNAVPGGDIGVAQQVLNGQENIEKKIPKVVQTGQQLVCGDCVQDGGAYGLAKAAQDGSMTGIVDLDLTYPPAAGARARNEHGQFAKADPANVPTPQSFAQQQAQALDQQLQLAVGPSNGSNGSNGGPDAQATTTGGSSSDASGDAGGQNASGQGGQQEAGQLPAMQQAVEKAASYISPQDGDQGGTGLLDCVTASCKQFPPDPATPASKASVSGTGGDDSPDTTEVAPEDPNGPQYGPQINGPAYGYPNGYPGGYPTGTLGYAGTAPDGGSTPSSSDGSNMDPGAGDNGSSSTSSPTPDGSDDN